MADVPQIAAANQAYLNKTPVTKPQDATNTAVNEEPKEDNKKKLALALAGLGAVALAGVAIYAKVKSGKAAQGANTSDIERVLPPEKGPDGGDEVIDKIRKFLDKNGNEVSDVKFNKGTASFGDNKLFTGTLEQTCDGKNIVVEYADGKAVKTTIDGTLYKTFAYSKAPDGKVQEQVIEIFDKDGAINSKTLNIFAEDGKLKRTHVTKSDGTCAALDFADGKLKAETMFDNTGNYMQYMEMYDNDGKIIKTIDEEKIDGFTTGFVNITEKQADGSSKIIKTWGNSYLDLSRASADEYCEKLIKSYNPANVIYKNSDGMTLKEFTNYTNQVTSYKRLQDGTAREFTVFPNQNLDFITVRGCVGDKSYITSIPKRPDKDLNNIVFNFSNSDDNQKLSKEFIEEVKNSLDDLISDFGKEGILTTELLELRQYADNIRFNLDTFISNMF